ncbi:MULTISPECIES: TetR/AcrR family transcriptional regulator [Brevundimonas]|jgi:AcrR family transcriptional regulator|uniref:TetR/AcrR family transcriptional regulator n=1 Tax=Brevundimonas TaxID=41275 RepID=UPI000462954A|nr:TetR/AcrR family transcriptional regulator [Brevundimonas naejangsanensis]
MLFLTKGVSGTSGKEIAAAAGVSERTVWRLFRTKESCVEPLLSQSALRFTEHMRRWSRLISIEDHLLETFALDRQSETTTGDNRLIVQLLGILPNEPDLRATWLLACQLGERGLIEIIASRLDRSPDEFAIRLCAAAVSAAMRTVDEDISLAVSERSEVITPSQVVARIADAIRAVSTVPFCDPVPLPAGKTADAPSSFQS